MIKSYHPSNNDNVGKVRVLSLFLEINLNCATPWNNTTSYLFSNLLLVLPCLKHLPYTTKVFRVKSFAVCCVHQVCGEKFRDFFHHHRLHALFMVIQLYKTATSVSTKALHSSRESSLKLSLTYLEMDESTLLTHVCADFTLSRMTMQSHEKNYSWSESEMKQITNHFLVSFFYKLHPNLLAETL